jgi:hypothetical protein
MLSVIMLSVFLLSAIMLSVIILSAIMLSVIILSIIMLSVFMPSVIMLSVIMLSVIMLSVFLLSAIMLSVIMPNVVALQWDHRYAAGYSLRSIIFASGISPTASRCHRLERTDARTHGRTSTRVDLPTQKRIGSNKRKVFATTKKNKERSRIKLYALDAFIGE